MSQTHFDVVIIGAGLAGIGAACRLALECPERNVAILERRSVLGGTWDLFRYPGIRSDSDMYTFGYPFRPWHRPQVMANGKEIREYIADTANEFGLDQRIEYGLKVIGADWSSAEQKWNVAALHEVSGELRSYSCNFLIGCTGYYNYDAGFLPKFPGEDEFQGLLVHPQNWPDKLDYQGKKVVVIGSGATAVTLIPAMADKTAHVTMLQRSPSYVVSTPGYDHISAWLARFLPSKTVYGFARRRNLWIQRGLYLACRRWPKLMRGMLLSQVRKHVGKTFDMSHFTPAYMPWDQRVCAVPDADLFTSLKSGRASIVTDTIETLTPTGITLKSGRELEADIIVTATGLNIQMLGGMQVRLDGRVCNPNESMTYKGVLVQDVPNFAVIFGYANAPWTLKSDLAARYLCRLFRHMDATHKRVAIPHDSEASRTHGSVLGQLASGYVHRGDALLPRQGRAYPWKVTHHYGRDRKMLLKDPIEDSWLSFIPAIEEMNPQASGA